MKIAALPLLFLFLAAAVQGQSALDGFDPNANGGIRVIVVQPDGKILIGGDFTTLAPNGGATVTRNYIARLNPDGTLDTAFNPSADRSVLSFAVQADGKIVAGGDFTFIGGQVRQHLARLDGTTGLADSFDPGLNGSVRAVAVQTDGKILAGGGFGSVGGVERFGIARFDGTTGLLDSFDPGAEDDVFSIVLQTDGKILVGGRFINIGGEMRRGIARLDPTTGHADSFDPSVKSGGFPADDVYAIAVQADGKILMGGSFVNVGGHGRNNIARVDPTTGEPDSFNPSPNELVWAIALQADGRILAAGNFTSIGGQPRNYIARLDPVTGMADSFDPHPSGGVVPAIAVQADGKILAGGYFTALAPNGGATVTRNRIARLETDGRLDQTLNVNSGEEDIGYIDATAVQPDGKILIGGDFTHISGVPRNNLARLNSDGTVDAAFAPNPSYQVYAIAVLADGKILVGGLFNTVGGQTRHNLVRLDGTTGLPDSFDPNPNEQVNSISVQADGKILVGGRFRNIGGASRRFMARLDPITGLADSFDPNPVGSPFGIFSLAVQLDGKILAGGEFSGVNSIGGQDRNYIARLDAQTGLADLFNPNANSFVYIVAAQGNDKVLAGGLFNSIGGQTRHGMARLDAQTGLADAFDPQPDSDSGNPLVGTMALQADGKILAGGVFDEMGGQFRDKIARLDGTSGLTDSFNPDANNEVYSIAIQADGKVLVGGFFRGPNSIGGQERQCFARLSNDTAARQNLAVMQNAVVWTREGSSPNLTRATFEYSTDNLNYTFLGNATQSGGNWSLTGVNLPTGTNIYVRGRGYYPSGQHNGSQSITESVRNVFFAAPGTLGNISTRVRVLSGDNVLIGGMIATGTAAKRVIIRAIGPSLTGFGVPRALENPTLELFQGSTLLFSNDDWGNSTQQAEIAASGLAPSHTLESAIIWTLAPGQGYTAVVRGINHTTGIGVVEAFDLDQAASSKLGNISTRGFVDVDDNVMIAGLIAGPGNGTSLKILVRALGPTLSDFGVPGALADTTLDLVNASGTVIRSNDNWQDDPQQRAAIEAAGLAPAHLEEAALVETVVPGAYTAIVRGSNRTTGVGLVEAYNIP